MTLREQIIRIHEEYTPGGISGGELRELIQAIDASMERVIGDDCETDPDKLGHFEVNEYMDMYEAINRDHAEQRQRKAEEFKKQHKCGGGENV